MFLLQFMGHIKIVNNFWMALEILRGVGKNAMVLYYSQIMDYADILYLIVWYTVKRTKQKIRYDHCRIIPYSLANGNIVFISTK